MSGSTTIDAGAAAQSRTAWSMRRWVAANAVGLGLTYGLFALLGDIADALGAEHGSGHGIAALGGLFIGAVIFIALRDRALAGTLGDRALSGVAAGIGLGAGFVVGYVIAGPPFDFVLGVVSLGIIGGAIQWRAYRHRLPRPGRMLLATIGAWLSAGVAALLVAVGAGDAIAGVFGGDGTVGFVAITVTIGVVAGTVGGSIEGAALRRRI
jgi:hypothetical protein